MEKKPATTARKARTQEERLLEMRAHPGVKAVYNEGSDGWWMDLRRGWTNAYDDRPGTLHGAHERTVAILYKRLAYVVACPCEHCAAAL